MTSKPSRRAIASGERPDPTISASTVLAWVAVNSPSTSKITNRANARGRGGRRPRPRGCARGVQSSSAGAPAAIVARDTSSSPRSTTSATAGASVAQERQAVRPVDEFLWTTLPSMPMPRHGIAGAVIGNRFHLVSGMMQSAGALTFLDPTLSTTTGDARYPGAAVRCAAANSCRQDCCRDAFAGSGNGCDRNAGSCPAARDGREDCGNRVSPGSERRSTCATTSTARKGR